MIEAVEALLPKGWLNYLPQVQIKRLGKGLNAPEWEQGLKNTLVIRLWRCSVATNNEACPLVEDLVIPLLTNVARFRSS